MSLPKKLDKTFTIKRITGLLLLGVSLILMITPSLIKCPVCSGWNIINPLCWIGFTGCQVFKMIISPILIIISLIMIVLGVIKIIKG